MTRRDPYQDVLVDCQPTEDGTCRYKASDAEHECVRNTGAPIGKNETCFYEAHALLAAECAAQGVPLHVTDPTVLQNVADIINGSIARKQAS